MGGAGAYLAKRIKKAEVVAYPEFGPEAIYRLEVSDFPFDRRDRLLRAEYI